jgi:hypothetical protein
MRTEDKDDRRRMNGERKAECNVWMIWQTQGGKKANKLGRAGIERTRLTKGRMYGGCGRQDKNDVEANEWRRRLTGDNEVRKQMIGGRD